MICLRGQSPTVSYSNRHFDAFAIKYPYFLRSYTHTQRTDMAACTADTYIRRPTAEMCVAVHRPVPSSCPRPSTQFTVRDTNLLSVLFRRSGRGGCRRRNFWLSPSRSSLHLFIQFRCPASDSFSQFSHETRARAGAQEGQYNDPRLKFADKIIIPKSPHSNRPGPPQLRGLLRHGSIVNARLGSQDCFEKRIESD